MNTHITSVPEHLESYLGRIEFGWPQHGGPKPTFQVVLCEGSPIGISGVKAIATLGLSNHRLRAGSSQRTLRQELILMYRGASGYLNLPAILEQVAAEAIGSHRAYAIGDVIGPRGELITGSQLEALCVCLPVYLPDSFQVLRLEGTEPVVFAWLVPIADSEASFVRRFGWPAFEEKLMEHNPDLLDFARSSIV